MVLFNKLSISGGGIRGPHPLPGGVNEDLVLHRRRLVRKTLSDWGHWGSGGQPVAEVKALAGSFLCLQQSYPSRWGGLEG